MLVGRCSSELSGHRPQGKLKSHSLRAKPTCPGVPWRDLLCALPSNNSLQLRPSISAQLGMGGGG